LVGQPGRFIIVAVGSTVPAKLVSSIAPDVGSCTATQVAAMNGTNIRCEIWIIRNQSGTVSPTYTVTFAQTTGSCGIAARVLDSSSDMTSGPTITAGSGNTGTSVSPDTNTVTPAVGDVLLCAGAWALNSASTARTHTGNSFLYNTSVGYTGGRVELGWAQSVNTTASKEVFTITSAEWAAIDAKLALAADRAAVAALVPKGLDTAVLDAASAY
jgi:hypothetical protein